MVPPPIWGFCVVVIGFMNFVERSVVVYLHHLHDAGTRCKGENTGQDSTMSFLDGREVLNIEVEHRMAMLFCLPKGLC